MTTGITHTIGAIDALLCEVSTVPLWSLCGDELATDLRLIARARARLADLELRLAHQATAVGLGAQVGAADTKAWWSNTTRQTRRETRRRLVLAAALDTRRVVTREAMGRGEVAEDQATVIVRALEVAEDQERRVSWRVRNTPPPGRAG